MSPSRTRVRRSIPVAMAAGLVALVMAVAVGEPVVGAAGQSARERRAQVRAEQARVAAQVDALEGNQAEIDAALAALDENVRGQQAALDDARRQVEESTAEVARAETAVAEANAEIDGLRAKLVSYAVDAYINPPEEDLMRRFEAPSAQEDATKRALLQMQSGEDVDVIDQLRAARQRLEDERSAAETARSTAASAALDAERALASLGEARAQQEEFATQVRARLDQRLSDAAYLAQVDASLGQAVAAEQAALAAAVARVPVSGAGGTATSATTPTTPRTVPTVPRPPLVTVGGITVNASIGDQLRGLLDAARADGIVLGGYGWRDVSNQIGLRMQNCGTSTYAVYEMPPDQCSPPTARPGMSLHERGLAIDFSVDGSFITSRTNEAFVWLSANAGTYGFMNLPSEPWHWSTTGG